MNTNPRSIHRSIRRGKLTVAVRKTGNNTEYFLERRTNRGGKYIMCMLLPNIDLAAMGHHQPQAINAYKFTKKIPRTPVGK